MLMITEYMLVIGNVQSNYKFFSNISISTANVIKLKLNKIFHY